ncbi:hypothetical protein GCM10011512_01010 [Tersicoccus solisilvae]|uniref:Uncharacterized protein n=1 Tax=Tersicoccus solisilvae TaxID=1882339 RepID=A0ABQ1NIV5_9MICC|nr:hypothetical protein GCM10011512_01010 [Tersicoccus solisilvae]
MRTGRTAEAFTQMQRGGDHHVQGFGASFFSRWLYFSAYDAWDASWGPAPLILDQRVAAAIGYRRWMWSVDEYLYYLDFCEKLQALWRPEEPTHVIEFTEFDGGWGDRIGTALVDAVYSKQMVYETKNGKGLLPRLRDFNEKYPDASVSLAVLTSLTEGQLTAVLGHGKTNGRTKASAVLEAALNRKAVGVIKARDYDATNAKHRDAYTAVHGLGPVTATTSACFWALPTSRSTRGSAASSTASRTKPALPGRMTQRPCCARLALAETSVPPTPTSITPSGCTSVHGTPTRKPKRNALDALPGNRTGTLVTGSAENRLAAEARARVLIDAQLEAAGWSVQDKKNLNLFAGPGVARRESVMKPGHGRADYLLYVDQRVVGVIEAKPQGHPLSGVEWQSAMYASGLPADVRLAARTVDGRLPFVFEASGSETHFTNGYDPDPRARRVFAFPQPGSLARILREADDDADAPTWRAKVRHLPPLDTGPLRPAQITAIQGIERSLVAVDGGHMQPVQTEEEITVGAVSSVVMAARSRRRRKLGQRRGLPGRCAWSPPILEASTHFSPQPAYPGAPPTPTSTLKSRERPLQDRADPSARPLADRRAGGTRDPRVRVVVEQPAPPRRARHAHPDRGRAGVLR